MEKKFPFLAKPPVLNAGCPKHRRSAGLGSGSKSPLEIWKPPKSKQDKQQPPQSLQWMLQDAQGTEAAVEGASQIAAPTNFHPHNVPFGCAAGGGCSVDLPSPSPNPHGFYWGGREPRTRRTGTRRGSWPQRLPSRFGSSPPWQEKPAQPGSAPNAGCQQKLGRRKGKRGGGRGR